MRAAYEARLAGPVLDQLFRQALHAGKKVRAQTAIAESPASVSGRRRGARAAGLRRPRRPADPARRRRARSASWRRGTCSRAAREIAFVANRTPERAAELRGAQFGAEPLPLRARRRSSSSAADVVVSSTSAPGLVLGRDASPPRCRARRGRPLLLVDLAVPRDLDPAIHELDGCYLYDIDDLEAVVAESLAGRRREAERAEAIVAEEAERFRDWHASLDVVPAIASLRARAEEIRAGELARVEGRLCASRTRSAAPSSPSPRRSSTSSSTCRPCG